MASGLAVISTDVGGLPYVLADGEDSLLVRPDDAGAMAGAVLRLLTEPGLSERLSRSARRKAGSFDWAKLLPRWQRLLNSVTASA
jgi:glycosyltransferase involved in cell wall biosynthesis